MTTDPHALTTVEAVRTCVGPESAAVRVKVFDRLDPTARQFLASSPMVLLSTACVDGVPDVSPKGEGPGFVLALDDRTLLLPERKGNQYCAKAFRRSQLWKPQAWPEPVKVSFGKMLAPRLGGGEDLERRIDTALEEDYRTNL